MRMRRFWMVFWLVAALYLVYYGVGNAIWTFQHEGGGMVPEMVGRAKDASWTGEYRWAGERAYKGEKYLISVFCFLFAGLFLYIGVWDRRTRPST